MNAIARPKSLTELVSDELRSRIIHGQIELGSAISEARIAKDLEVSRTPVREAINRLESEGLVRTEPQRGTFVFSLAPEELAKICLVRVCLERTALTSAFMTQRERLVSELTACTKRMEAAVANADHLAYFKEDTIFHMCFFDCADNRFLKDSYMAIATKMSALRTRVGRDPEHVAKSYREHLEMVAAISKGDLEGALDVLEHHIGQKEGSYWRIAASDGYAAGLFRKNEQRRTHT